MGKSKKRSRKRVADPDFEPDAKRVKTQGAQDEGIPATKRVTRQNSGTLPTSSSAKQTNKRKRPQKSGKAKGKSASTTTPATKSNSILGSTDEQPELHADLALLHSSDSEDGAAIPPLLITFSRFPERPTAEDRNTEAKLYEYLGDEDSRIRETAALTVARGLLGENRIDPVSDAELDRHVNRLLKGLASGRNASRLGFSIVLTEILATLFGPVDLGKKYLRLNFPAILAKLVETEAPSNSKSTSKIEETNYYLGQLFGVKCFLDAHIIANDKSRWQPLLARLVAVVEKKAILFQSCASEIARTIPQLDKTLARQTMETLHEKKLALSAEGLAIWLAVRQQFPELSKKPWKDPFNPETLDSRLPVLVRVLGASNISHNQQQAVNAPSTWTPQLHFVWDWIALRFAKEGKDMEETFRRVWNSVFDDVFFSDKATPERKYQGFLLFQKMLSEFATRQRQGLVLALFTPKFARCLMNQAAQKGRYLHSAAMKVLAAIERTAAREPSSVIPLLTGLVVSTGTYAFDQRTKSKTASKVLQCVPDKDAPSIIKLLDIPIRESGRLDSEHRQSLLVEYVKYLHKMATSTREGASGVATMALDRLCNLAFAEATNTSNYGMTDETRDFCRDHVESAFAKFCTTREGFQQFCGVLCSFNPELVDMDEEIRAKQAEANITFVRLLGDTSGDIKATQALAVLYGYGLFLIYSGDADSVSTLSDLDEFRRRFESDKDGKETATFLVETLLAINARSSPLGRQVSKHVFGEFASYMNADALKLLMEPLVAGEDMEGHRMLFATEDEFDMSEDELEIGNSDGEDISGSGTDGEDAEDASSEGEESADEAGSGEEDAQQKAFEDDLAKLLKTRRLDQQKEDGDDDDDDAASDSSSAMTDSEMMAMDEQISAAFKGRKASLPPSKKETQLAKEAVIRFKHRVLDLVSAYLDCSTKRDVADGLALLPDLVHVASVTTSPPLAARVGDIVFAYKSHFRRAERKAWSAARLREQDEAAAAVVGGGGKGKGKGKDKAKGKTTGEGGPIERAAMAMDGLERIHEGLGRQESQAFARTASTACLTLASALQVAGMLDEVRALYERTGNEDGKVHRCFFDNWRNWCQSQNVPYS